MTRSTLGAIGAILLLLTAGCWVTPAGPERAAGLAVAAFPQPADWPKRAILTDPSAGAPLPSWITPCGCFGQGFLYRLSEETTAPEFEYELFVFISTAGPEASEGQETLMRGDEAWLAPRAANSLIIEISRRTDLPLRGTCFYLPSLMGVTDQEAPVISTLRDQGWRMVVLYPSVQTYDRSFFALSLDASDEANAAIIAPIVDSYLAGAAYATEAALAWVGARDAEVQHRPIVVVGSSLGALSTPPVVARLRSVAGSRVDAAVLIGGGAGLLHITVASPLMADRFMLLGMRSTGTKGEQSLVVYDQDRRDRLLELATIASRLDPLHTAAALRDIPVLQLHATQDKIVPAARGDDLYERLAQPERWSYRLGHTGLFLMLPFEADDIARWIGAHTPPPDAAPDVLP